MFFLQVSSQGKSQEDLVLFNNPNIYQTCWRKQALRLTRMVYRQVWLPYQPKQPHDLDSNSTTAIAIPTSIKEIKIKHPPSIPHMGTGEIRHKMGNRDRGDGTRRNNYSTT